MKYVFCVAPMLLCSEIVSIVCLLAITICFLLDLEKARREK